MPYCAILCYAVQWTTTLQERWFYPIPQGILNEPNFTMRLVGVSLFLVSAPLLMIVMWPQFQCLHPFCHYFNFMGVWGVGLLGVTRVCGTVGMEERTHFDVFPVDGVVHDIIVTSREVPIFR